LIQDFYSAGQKAFLFGAAYDFKAAGAPGLMLAGNIATGFDAINPATGAAVANSTEYDIDLNYRFSDKSWPKWAQPLWLRMRAGVLVPAGGGARTENYREAGPWPGPAAPGGQSTCLKRCRAEGDGQPASWQTRTIASLVSK